MSRDSRRDRLTAEQFAELIREARAARPRTEALVITVFGDERDVVAALEAGEVEQALVLVIGQIAAADAALRDRLREVAVAVFDGVDPEDPLVTTYRRRLAAALY